MSTSQEPAEARNTHWPSWLYGIIAWSRERQARILFVATWIGSTVVVATRLDQGWVAWDDGAFAQSAHRVLEGQLPHREFAELYTGGMTFLNAGMFRAFGENLIWLRIPLFVLFLAFVPCVYLIARRFVGPAAACLTTLFAVTWSVPTYPAAVPSWYLLMFSVFGALCVIRYFESASLRWLFAAGLFGGLAIDFKIVGIWYVLAVLLSLVVAAGPDQGAPRGERRATPMLLVAGAAGSIVLLLTLSILASHLGAPEIFNFLVPVAVLCCLPIVIEVRHGGGCWQGRLSRLGMTTGLFLLGVGVPLLVFAVPYILLGSLGDLVQGVFVSPQTRLQYAYAATLGPAALLFAIPLIVIMLRRRGASPRLRLMLDVPLAGLAVALVASGGTDASYAILWNTVRSLAPFVVMIGTLVVILAPHRQGDSPRRFSLVLLLLLAGLTSLIQFPFGTPLYFCYVVPLFGLAAVAMLGFSGAGRGLFPSVFLAACVLFGLIYLEPLVVGKDRPGFHSDPQMVQLDPRRASIRVMPSDRVVYGRAVALLRSHSSGRYTFAGPDAPEVYFLSRLENPTRSLFDFLDTTDSARGDQLLVSLRENQVTAIAINSKPPLSEPLGATTLSRLATMYPYHERVGVFDIRWK